MGSAVSSVFGGGGSGGILGAVGGIVGGIFGGPIGSMIGQAIGGMLQSAIEGGLNQAVDTLVKEHGMPKFLGDEVKQIVSNVMGQQRAASQIGVSDEAKQIAHEHFGQAVDRFKQDFQNFIVDNVVDSMRSPENRGRKVSGGGWLQAIASVMGTALGDKAKEMVTLSNKISKASSEKTAAANGKDEAAKEAAAGKFQELMMQFQATSQEFNYMQTTFSTALKGLGEGLASVARKQ